MGHLGLLKAKLAKLKRELITPKGGGATAGEGFDVAKTGDARIGFVGELLLLCVCVCVCAGPDQKLWWPKGTTLGGGPIFMICLYLLFIILNCGGLGLQPM